jgi:hypothetical protein
VFNVQGPLSSGFKPAPFLFSSNHFFASLTAAVHRSGDVCRGEPGVKLPDLILENGTDSENFWSRLKEHQAPVKSWPVPILLLGISFGVPYSWASGSSESVTRVFKSSTNLSNSSLRKCTLMIQKKSISLQILS